jgi:transcriptional regulator with XRE-family HTH domain|nr:MAG TPA: helix-turn-helix domain protein [Caudoviricetes sp.]
MTINTKWFREKMADAGLSQRQLAKKLGLDQSAISLTFSGRRRMKFEEAADIARLLGLPVSDVLSNAGVPIEEGRQTVPIMGFMDSTGEIHCNHETNAERVITPVAMPEGSAAIQCRTAKSPLEYMDGWMIFKEKPTTTPPIGRFCIVKCKGSIRTIGTIRRGYKAGRFNITGPAIDVIDADLEWASPIVAIRT